MAPNRHERGCLSRFQDFTIDKSYKSKTTVLLLLQLQSELRCVLNKLVDVVGKQVGDIPA